MVFIPWLCLGLVSEKRSTPAPGRQKKEQSLDCLVRYGFEQLDALNGYAAGMPSPWYYDQVWREIMQNSPSNAFANLTAKVLVELGQIDATEETGRRSIAGR